MILQDDSIEFPDDIFRLLRDYIRDFCGIYFDDSSKYFLQRRLSRRVRARQLDSFRDYYHFLTYDRRKEEELVDVIDCLTTNETYFNREESQLNAFIDEIVPEIISRKGGDRSLRVWSAGCSSGEEPYTVAMLLIDKGYANKLDIEIVGTDINHKVLNMARRGIYRRSSFRNTDKSLIRKHFEEESHGNYRISEDVKKLVSFSYLNLFDQYKLKFMKGFDVIFCRNVIIYFDLQSKKKLIDVFYERLNGGGYLLLGHAESLMNISTAFALVHLKNDMVYQKPMGRHAGVPGGVRLQP